MNTTANSATSRRVLDPAHSEQQFKVTHLMISKVTGSFTRFNVEAETPGSDFTLASRIIFTAEAASVSTHDASRDNHLRSAEFFDADHYPVLRFEGTRLEPHRDHYHLHGALTIRGTTRPITLKAEYPALVVDFHGQTKAGFTVEGKLSRKAYGLTWSVLTEAGVVVVGDEVKILAEIQLVKAG